MTSKLTLLLRRHSIIYENLLKVRDELEAEAEAKGCKPSCECCGRPFTMIYGPHLYRIYLLSPFNVSPDRLDCDIRQYRAWLIRLICAFCNMVRMAKSVDKGKEQVMAMLQSWEDGSTEYKNAFIEPVPEVWPRLTAAGEQRVENIADARLKDVVQRCRKTQLDGYANRVKKNNSRGTRRLPP